MGNGYFRKTLRSVFSLAMTASLLLGGSGVDKLTVNAAADTDEIMLGVFFTSEEDSTNTLYWSTDGLNFYELSQPYVDATPKEMGDGKSIIKYTDQDLAEYEAKYPYAASRAPFARKDVTLHDPSILYKDGYFWMISGDKVGSSVRIMYGYSKDLERWSYPDNGGVNIAIDYDGDFDMVAPDFMVDSKGDVYIVFSLGYYAEMHGDDALNDKMQPYIVKVEKLEVDPSRDVNTDREPLINVRYGTPMAVKLPCADKDYNMGGNHIDGSLYEEDGTYYLCVKENGVTDEIWSIDDLSKVGDSSAWTLVCEDVVTGYEGPCLTKYAGEYFMYTDRLATYVPADRIDAFEKENGHYPNNEEFKALRNQCAGMYVTKASTKTTGKLDKYVGWLEANTKELVLYDTKGEKKSAQDTGMTAQNTSNGTTGGTYNGARHGTVITVTGEAAARVRALAEKNSSKKDTSDSYDPKAWANEGWYKKESYRDWRLGGYIANYWYEKDVRQGVKPGNKDYRGKEICDQNVLDANGNGTWFWLDAVNDGRMATAMNTYNEKGEVIADGYANGNYEVAQPVDQDLYNEIGSKEYGLDATAWKWVCYDWYGQMVKSGDEANNRFYVNGKNGYYYRYDPITGGMVKGVWSFKEGDNELFVFFDTTSGIRYDWKSIEALEIPYEKVTLFTEDNGIWDDGQGGTSNDTPVYRVKINGTNVDFDPNGIIVGSTQTKVNAKDVAAKLPKVEYCSPKDKPAKEDGDTPDKGWYEKDGAKYWYENGVRQGTVDDPEGVVIDGTIRGREIYDPESDGWYWLDADSNGAMASSKDVYQVSLAGEWGDRTNDAGEKVGKWVRYDPDGKMIKGWCAGKDDKAECIESPDQASGRDVYYFDPTFGTMAKGEVVIGEKTYTFDTTTGILQQ